MNWLDTPITFRMYFIYLAAYIVIRIIFEIGKYMAKS
jgi:hypothetical protein